MKVLWKKNGKDNMESGEKDKGEKGKGRTERKRQGEKGEGRTERIQREKGYSEKGARKAV